MPNVPEIPDIKSDNIQTPRVEVPVIRNLEPPPILVPINRTLPIPVVDVPLDGIPQYEPIDAPTTEQFRKMINAQQEPKKEEEDYMKSAPAPVVKMIEDLRKQAESATAELRKEREARADAQSVEKAKGWANLNLNAEKVGPALRRLSETDSELAKSVEEILSSVNAQAESASIFAEIGKSADFKEGNAYGRMTAMAKSAVEDGVAKSFEQALSDVAIKNPDLYSQYLSEKGA